MLNRLELGMPGQHLVVDAADPVPPRADLAVGHGPSGVPSGATEGLEHLLDGVERNAADQQGVRAHASSHLLFVRQPL